MHSLGAASWQEIQALRDQASAGAFTDIESAAQHFATVLATSFPSVVLARTFLVVPFKRLPPADQAFARALVKDDARLVPTTPTLSLLGTHGRDPRWADRKASAGHLAIPLLDRHAVSNIPMIARLLADLEVDVDALAANSPIATRRMTGGLNSMFYVGHAATARDEQNRPIINTLFATDHGIETVFGMGGAYFDGTLAIAILFCAEALDRAIADRYASLISGFKLATSHLYSQGSIWRS